MRLEKASYKAIRYACMNFHYAKRLPAPPMVGFSVFENDVWCGVVVFNNGIEGIQKPYGVKMGNVCELVRVALNGNQSTTTKCVSIAIKLLKKQNPLLKIIVSYADSDKGHFGVIYQALNWIYAGSMHTSDRYFCKKTGKSIHSRQISKTGYKVQFGINKKCFKTDEVRREKAGVKHKYIYPLDKSMIPLCKALSKPYPKKHQTAAVPHKGEGQATGLDGAFDSTMPLKTT